MFVDAYAEDMDYKKRLESLMHLAELCIEVMKQNEEHYADVSYAFISITLSLVHYVTSYVESTPANFWKYCSNEAALTQQQWGHRLKTLHSNEYLVESKTL